MTWDEFGPCPRVAAGRLKRRCGAQAGQPCRNLRTLAQATLPHRERPARVRVTAAEALAEIAAYVNMPGIYKDVNPIRKIIGRVDT
ncbi:MAG TPA: hypothetical protein VJS92_14240 [Candidatus Polarisedimenticolaceae bacterium]|nr:hypothetical protein [Candidatus Polarisedimenticolaceae bacterium]